MNTCICTIDCTDWNFVIKWLLVTSDISHVKFDLACHCCNAFFIVPAGLQYEISN